MTSSSTESQGALRGVRVVEFGQYIPGPMLGMLLAEQGADVIKVERPGGDPARTEPAFATWNRSKRSVELDLKTPDGLASARELIDWADVAIENFRPGVADRLGIGYGSTGSNPGLVYCSLPGFGEDSPHRDDRGWETIVGAATGTHQGVSTAPIRDPGKKLAIEFVERLVQDCAPLRRNLLPGERLSSALVLSRPDEFDFDAEFLKRALVEHHLQAQPLQVEVALRLEDNLVSERCDVIVLPAGDFQVRPNRLARFLELLNRPAGLLSFGPARLRTAPSQYKCLDFLVLSCESNGFGKGVEVNRRPAISHLQQIGPIHVRMLGHIASKADFQRSVGRNGRLATTAGRPNQQAEQWHYEEYK